MDFFALKKLVSLLLHLVPGCLLLILAGMVLSRCRRYRRLSTITMITGMTVLLLASTPAVSNKAINSLENQFRVMLAPPADTVLFLTLGNYATNDTSLPANARLGAIALSRITETIRLWHQQQQAILFLGGPSRFAMRDFAIANGVASARIILDDNVRDTIDEIEAAAAFVQAQGLAGKTIVVSSATHLPRAKLIVDHARELKLTKQKLHPHDFAPADFIAAPVDRKFHASSGFLYKTDRVVHEYVGMLWVKLKLMLAPLMTAS
jgi:uncharacterized SAM-binding protein YcdF (DUF218 family)